MTITRVHPLFSTLAEASEKTLFSDHLPILVNVPIDDDQAHDLKMISYNVMGALAENNLTREKSAPESASKRYQRVINGLKVCADKLKADAIVLQEVSSDDMLFHLKMMLDEGWGCIPSIDVIKKDQPQQLTLYRKSTLGLTNAKDWDPKRKTLSASFIAKKANKTIQLHNVWGDYDIFPDKIEAYYHDLFSQRTGNECVVILGDTNSRIAPVLTDDFKNLTTGIIPGMFNYNYNVPDTTQVPDHPDGGFYSDKEGKIRQLEINVIDIEAGKISSDKRTLNEITSKMSPAEKAVWHAPRGILCLDHYYQNAGKKIDGKTIFEYESELQKNLGDDQILVRMTSTICNEKGILVRFKPGRQNDTANHIVDLMPEESVQLSLLTDSSGRRFSTLFVTSEKIVDLVNAIKTILTIKNLDQSSLDKGIQEATEAYVANSNVILAVVSFGIYGASKRDEGIKCRVDAARLVAKLPHELLIALLENDKTGESMRSFRYFLVSKLTGVNVKTDIQAKNLIDLLVKELKMNPNSNVKVRISNESTGFRA